MSRSSLSSALTAAEKTEAVAALHVGGAIAEETTLDTLDIKIAA